MAGELRKNVVASSSRLGGSPSTIKTTTTAPEPRTTRQATSLKGKEKEQTNTPIAAVRIAHPKNGSKKRAHEEEESEPGALRSYLHLPTRLPSPSTSNSSDLEDDTAELESERNEEQPTDEEGEEDGDSFDWWDPRTLPVNVQYRTAAQLKMLEFGTFNSALHDVVNDKIDLRSILYGWEELRKQRKFEEEGQKETGAQGGNSPRATEPSGSHVNGSSSNSPSNLSTQSSSLSQADRDPTSSSALPPDRASTAKFDIFNEAILPIPSSLLIAQTSRWPIHTHHLHPSVPLSEALTNLALSIRSRQTALLAHPYSTQRMKKKIRSAYEEGGPLARSTYSAARVRTTRSRSVESLEVSGDRSVGAISSRMEEEAGENIDVEMVDQEREREYEKEEEIPTDSNTSESEGSESSTSSLFESSDELLDQQLSEDLTDPTLYPPDLIRKTSGLLEDILEKLKEKIPKSPWPALDVWEKRTRNEEITNREVALDWEDVLMAAVAVKGIPDSVVEALKARMIQLYGVTRNDPETIARSPPPEYEVLVVDEASADEDILVSEEELPSLAELFGRARSPAEAPGGFVRSEQSRSSEPNPS